MSETELENKIQILETKLAMAIEALKFYADPATYGQGESFAELSRVADCDLEYTAAHRGFDVVAGKRARHVMSDILETNPRRKISL